MDVATTSGFGGVSGTGPRGSTAGRRRPQLWFARRPVWVAALVIAALVGLALRPSDSVSHVDRPRPRSVSPTAHLPVAGLPTLGPARAVEVDNPALNDVGDPYVLPVPSGVDGMSQPGYALYWTTDWTANVPTAVSTDLVHWRRVADALPRLPSWALQVRPPPSWSAPTGVSTMTWGPSVHRVDDGWVLYYSTEEAATRQECVGAALSSRPTGPFTDTSSAPLVCQRALGGDIDASVVVPGPGRLALVWKNNGNSNGTAVGIWEQSLSADGRATTGRPVRLVGADQSWEHGNIEGPAMLADTKGGWWLFYSGGSWQSDTYDTGVAWCATPAGPCRQPATTPLLASTPSAVSPGGLDTFVDHQGRLWASYSAFPEKPASVRAAMASPRVLELAPIRSH
jgi:beta-xylosidase